MSGFAPASRPGALSADSGVASLPAALESLAGSTTQVRTAQLRLEDAVLAAREAGASWAQVGDATGMSRQAAHARWGHQPRGECRRTDCDCPHHLPHDCPCGHGGRGHRSLDGGP
mgnify:CR=1 FL=1|jgi:hypothetical protein